MHLNRTRLFEGVERFVERMSDLRVRSTGIRSLAEAIRSGLLAPGDELPSITELSALQEIGTGVIRHAMTALAADGLIIARQGRASTVAGEPSDRAGVMVALDRPGGTPCVRVARPGDSPV